MCSPIYYYIFIMKKYIFLTGIVFLLAGCISQKTQPVTVTPEPAPITNDAQKEPENVMVKETQPSTTKPAVKKATTTTVKSYTAAEVATHKDASSCWLIISGKVYDVTRFIPSHPGGREILNGCGKDATAMFASHPERAKTMKEDFYIGDLKQ